jgi:quercetin dioxygenase-like cupin family protein
LFLLGVALGPMSFAQVQVSEEPMHHKVFDNGWVRVLDVHVPPGDTSLWHKHSTPSVFLILSNTKTGSQVKVEPGKPSFADGRIWFEGFYDTPRIHRVWNEDDHEFHVIDMELPHKPYKDIDPPIKDPSFQLLFDERPVRGYRMSLAAKRAFVMRGSKANMVVIRVDDGNEAKVYNTVLRKKGDYVFIPAESPLDFQNEGQAEVKLAVFELK